MTEEELENILVDNVKNCWNTDRATALQLSGGVDSSLIAQWLSCLHPNDEIKSYSVLFDDKNRRHYKARSEKKWIDIVTKRFGFTSSEFMFSPNEIKRALPAAIFHNEVPITGASTAMYYLLAKALRDKISVVLTGEAVDDIFNGYFNGQKFDASLNSMLRYFIEPQHISQLFKISTSNDPLRKPHKTFMEPHLEDFSQPQKASLITMNQSLHALLARHDRMFMSQSIEGRPPFASKNIVEARFNLTDDKIFRNEHGKFILKQICSKYFGPEFAFRHKIGFSSPYGDWLSDKNYWGSYWRLLNKDLIGTYLNWPYIQDLLDMPNDSIKWSGQNLNMLMSVLNFQLWYCMYFENKDPEDLANYG